MNRMERMVCWVAFFGVAIGAAVIGGVWLLVEALR